jgi:hypothetical protein
MCQSGQAPRLFRPALRRSTALILGNAPLEGEGERTFFAFFTLRCCKHTVIDMLRNSSSHVLPPC